MSDVGAYLSIRENTARQIFERAAAARATAVGYHRKVYAASRLVAHAYQTEGFPGLIALQRHLVATDADRVIIAEVRHLTRCAESRLEGPPPGAH